jgi:hypothetical protein
LGRVAEKLKVFCEKKKARAVRLSLLGGNSDLLLAL